MDKRKIREYMIIDFKLCLSSKEIKMECEDNYVSVVCKGQALTGCIWKSSFLFRYRSAKRVFSAQTLTNFPHLRWPLLAFLFISFFRFFFCRKNNYWGILNKQKNILDFWFTPWIKMLLRVSSWRLAEKRKITQNKEIHSKHIDNTHLYIIFV